MRRYGVYIFLSLILSNVAVSQTTRTVVKLSDDLQENSGMVHYGSGLLYFINDGGNTPQLHRYDTFSKQYNKVTVTNASNVDWEDLAQDDNLNLYIGDFGNNGNARTNLKIYKTVDPETVSGNEITADTISFTYENQTEFPPNASHLNFDCESMIWYEDSLYLFSKNRTSPYDGWCYMYVLSDKKGTQVAQLRDSILLTAGTKEFDWITAADVRGDTLVLLSSNKVHVFNGFLSDDLSALSRKDYSIGFSQKEAVSFGESSNELFVSDEFQIIGNNLYLVTLEDKTNSILQQQFDGFEVMRTSHYFKVSQDKNIQSSIYIYSLLGAELYAGSFTNEFSSNGIISNHGAYMVQLVVGGKTYGFKWYKSD
ncbi:MAG: hypothetical protein COA58_16020 [Bacteroidetes bacterium]|nr:MAG: hypothetical protein COA58_16020 [Bacteroidota bacterium]